jgi:Terminase RNaseH-like domain
LSGKYTVNAGWDDVPHLSEAEKAQQLAGYQPYQRDARSKGLPVLGAGAIYPISEDYILVDPFPIPDWMPQCYALDVGWRRTAALWAAHDINQDVVYLYSEYYRAEAEPPVHANAIASRGKWIPGVIDPASRGRGQRDGERLIRVYHELGLELLFPSANDLEAGIYECWIRLSTGRMKVFRSCANWLAEYRFYQRDEKGRIKDDQNDHLMDTMRYIILSGLARAVVRPAHMWTTGRGGVSQHTSDYDPIPYGSR